MVTSKRLQTAAHKQGANTVLSIFLSSLYSEVAAILSDFSRDSAIFSRLMGLDGKPPESLRKVALGYGLSAERVRQICDRISTVAVPSLATDSRHVDLRNLLVEALSLIATAAPGACDSLEAQLQSVIVADGVLLIDEGESPASVVRIGGLLGLNGHARVEDWAGVEAIAPASMPDCFGLLLTHARKLSGASGAVSTAFLAHSFHSLKGVELQSSEVEAMLSPFSEFIAEVPGAGDATRWYSFSGGVDDTLKRAKNRIGSLGWCSLTHLCSFEPVGTRSADTASRAFTRSKYLIHVPEEVMTELLKRRGFLVEGDKVTLKVKAKGYQLPPVQAEMVGVLRDLSAGGPVRQVDFMAACNQVGIKTSTMRAYLFRSGLFHCSGGLCQLAP